MKKFTLISVLFFAFLLQMFAQEIGKVEFRQEGNFKFPDAVLRDNVQTKKGLMFSERILNDDVRRLYALGVFADVVSIVETLPDGRKSAPAEYSAHQKVQRTPPELSVPELPASPAGHQTDRHTHPDF